MVRLDLEIALAYDVVEDGVDFIFNVEAATTSNQRVLSEHLQVEPPVALRRYTDPQSGNRTIRLRANRGALRLTYCATVDILHDRGDPLTIQECPVEQLPPEALGFLNPSRYCPSDALTSIASQNFGGLWHGYERVATMAKWVESNIQFASGTSNSLTSAADTLASRVGVCRDFAHVMIALARALNIPARFVTGTDYGADPALGPPDFHAYVEVYLAHRWYIFDPSGTGIPMGFVRIATGRDAADAAFAMIFGKVMSYAPLIRATPVLEPGGRFDMPVHCADALSTDDGTFHRTLNAEEAC